MIFLIEDFLTAEKCKCLIEGFLRASSSTPPGCPWIRLSAKRTEFVARGFRELGLDDAHGVLSEARERMLEATRRCHQLGHECSIEFTLLSEMRAGDRHGVHADNERRAEDGKWVPNHTAFRSFTTVLYLNDAGVDFTGGELRFTELRQQILPRAGCLVGFRCDHHHSHEVPEVVSGKRYALSTWYTLDDLHRESWHA
jgi:predicted 2-oxoglutarate/Fe(II)-dependent dioxygenase YbiX